MLVDKWGTPISQMIILGTLQIDPNRGGWMDIDYRKDGRAVDDHWDTDANGGPLQYHRVVLEMWDDGQYRVSTYGRLNASEGRNILTSQTVPVTDPNLGMMIFNFVVGAFRMMGGSVPRPVMFMS